MRLLLCRLAVGLHRLARPVFRRARRGTLSRDGVGSGRPSLLRSRGGRLRRDAAGRRIGGFSGHRAFTGDGHQLPASLTGLERAARYLGPWQLARVLYGWVQIREKHRADPAGQRDRDHDRDNNSLNVCMSHRRHPPRTAGHTPTHALQRLIFGAIIRKPIKPTSDFARGPQSNPAVCAIAMDMAMPMLHTSSGLLAPRTHGVPSPRCWRPMIPMCHSKNCDQP